MLQYGKKTCFEASLHITVQHTGGPKTPTYASSADISLRHDGRRALSADMAQMAMQYGQPGDMFSFYCNFPIAPEYGKLRITQFLF